MSAPRSLSLVLAVAALALAGPLSAEPPAVGAEAPPLAQFAFEGNLPVLEGKVVLLDFWASWCAPCRETFPILAEMQAEFGAQGLVVVGVSLDQRAKDYQRFLDRLKPAFATVRDASAQAAEAYQPPAMPSSFLLGRDGRVAARWLTHFEPKRYRESLREAIVAALAEAKN